MAGTINVDDTCSLAHAIDNANDDFAVQPSCEAGTGDDTIILHRNVTLAEELPNITSTITIQGRGHTIDGADGFRVFTVGNYDGGENTLTGNLTIYNLTITKGNAGSGGGIFIDTNSTLTIYNSTITGNTATTASGGGIYITLSPSTTALSLTIQQPLLLAAGFIT